MGMQKDVATEYGVVTPSDTTQLDFDAIWVGVGGNVAIQKSAGDTAVVFTGVPAGTFLPVKGARVMSTSTTATTMVWVKW